MLFPDEALFNYVLVDLGRAVAAAPAPPINALPCDRYVARSCLQKAIRRAEPILAQRALANLFQHDRRLAWRALTIIALEDVGVANADLLAGIVAAQRDRSWRTQMGGDWPVLAEIARQMAESLHCQAACDLLLRVTNDPAMDAERSAVLELHTDALAERLWDRAAPPAQRALAALALGGELAEGQRHRDPAAVFDILSEAGRSSHVVATCRAAWKISRNPMSFLLPLVWDQWMNGHGDRAVRSDAIAPADMIGDVPGYGIDQFTRVGGQVARTYLAQDAVMKSILDSAGIKAARQPRVFGDILFLVEGSLMVRRVHWKVGESLRHPHRLLPGIVQLGSHVGPALQRCEARASQIANLRAHHLQRASANDTP